MTHVHMLWALTHVHMLWAAPWTDRSAGACAHARASCAAANSDALVADSDQRDVMSPAMGT